MKSDPKPLSGPKRPFHFNVRALFLFFPGFLVGGGLVLYSALALREVLSQDPKLGGDVLRFTQPSCPSGTNTTTELNLTESGKLIIYFAVTPSAGEPICDQLEVAIDTPNDKPAPVLSADAGQNPEKKRDNPLSMLDVWWRRVQKSETYFSETKALTVSAPVEHPCSAAASDGFVSEGELICRSYFVNSNLAPAANIHIDLEDALVRRTYTKAVLSFIVINSSNIKLGLPAKFDIGSLSVKEFQNEPEGGFQFLTFTAGSPSGQKVTLFLEDLKRGENKDFALLIYGAVLGTGLALLAEAAASSLKRFVAPQKEAD